MDWLAKMNSALDYIEENLTGEVDYAVAARKACCSSFNFQRMFSFITGTSLAEYVRRRRLTQAGIELQNSSIKVLDLAVKYGYDSGVAFSRAFQTVHGITPTQARGAGVTLKAYPRISFQVTIKGVQPMNYRIETKEAFQMFGLEGVFHPDKENENAPRTPHDLWVQSQANGEYERLFHNAGGLPSYVSPELCRLHGACGYRKTEEDTFPYMLGAFVGPASKTEGYTVVDIPAYTWVIFPSEKGNWDNIGDVIENLYKRVYSEWLPASGYELMEGVDLEIYGGTDAEGYIELWFPVKQRG